VPTWLCPFCENTNPLSSFRKNIVLSVSIRVHPWLFLRSQLFQEFYFSHNQQLTRNFFKTPHALPPHSTQKAMLDSENFESEKRNCGRTGPTSPEGRATSSKNSIKHGSCSQTLILPFESEESWLLLLNRWLQTYQPPEDSLLYDFVLKTAQAEWYRMRAQRNLDCHECSQQGLSPSNWTPEYIKKHDLLLRYRTTAERSFQRTFRLLEQFCKLHPTVPTSPKPADPKPESVFRVIGEDPDSPTGLTLCHESINGVETPVPRPYYPPDHSPP
jgi:hypothetical protein